jgi:hypothetical protein
MTKDEALAFIHSHGSDILAEDFAEELAQVFGHSLAEIGIEPKLLTAAFPLHTLPGWEGRLTVPMPHLAAALAGMGSIPSQAMEGLWNAISQLSADAIERGHGFEAGLDVEQITLHVHLEVHDKDEPIKKNGETLPQSA